MSAPVNARPVSAVRDDRSSGHTSNGGRLLTAEQVAERWQVKTSHVWRLARDGMVPVVSIGRYRRFRAEDLETWEQNGGRGL
jgi:excisionase family DNA binding protein